MTTLIKLEANQRNAQLSTGPRTAEGKATVARNATKHGIFSSVPVIPGEDPGVWEAHRAGVVDSFVPVGLLEVNLAERAALLLWRLQRLARYEAETVATAMEDVEVPPPPLTEEAIRFGPSPKRKTREEQLWDIRESLRKARRNLAEVSPACDFFANSAVAESGGAVPFEVAATILDAALGLAETAENVRGDPPRFEGKAFLKKLDVSLTDAESVTWTPDVIRRGMAIYAGYAQEPAEQFIESVRTDIDERAEEAGRTIRRLEREEAALVRRLVGGIARKQAAKLLPTDGRDERIAKYERHLHNLLTSTLHELERLQARRDGEAVPPATVADVNVTVQAE